MLTFPSVQPVRLAGLPVGCPDAGLERYFGPYRSMIACASSCLLA
jgi:hypothetical protein